MLGNMSGYPQWVGEWVRLKASPSAKTLRALLLDPAIVDRLNGWVGTKPRRIDVNLFSDYHPEAHRAFTPFWGKALR